LVRHDPEKKPKGDLSQMINLAQRIEPDPDVVVTELEEGKEAVLLHLGTKNYFTLNETGLFIWQMFGNNITPGEICDALPEKFDVSPEKAKECVLNLIEELISEKLVRVVDV